MRQSKSYENRLKYFLSETMLDKAAVIESAQELQPGFSRGFFTADDSNSFSGLFSPFRISLIIFGKCLLIILGLKARKSGCFSVFQSIESSPSLPFPSLSHASSALIDRISVTSPVGTFFGQEVEKFSNESTLQSPMKLMGIGDSVKKLEKVFSQQVSIVSLDKKVHCEVFSVSKSLLLSLHVFCHLVFASNLVSFGWKKMP